MIKLIQYISERMESINVENIWEYKILVKNARKKNEINKFKKILM